MKKLMAAICGIIVGLTMLVHTACTPEQGIAVSKQLGIAAAVGWIGTDNPSAEDIANMKSVLTVIRDNSTNVTAGASYYALVYPVADKYIGEKIKPEQQPMARLGAAWLLSGIDTAFAMNPSWAEKQSNAVKFVQSFCDGALIGLNMAPSDPVIQAASRQVPVRIQAKRIR